MTIDSPAGPIKAPFGDAPIADEQQDLAVLEGWQQGVSEF
jgi:hypothetical protein